MHPDPTSPRTNGSHADELALENRLSVLCVSSPKAPKPAQLQRDTSRIIRERNELRSTPSIAYHSLPDHVLTPDKLKALTASLPFIISSEQPHEYNIILLDSFHTVSRDSIGELHRTGCVGKFFITVAPHVISEMPTATFESLCQYVFHHASTITCKNLLELTDRVKEIFNSTEKLYSVDLSFAQCVGQIATLLPQTITELTMSMVSFQKGDVEALAKRLPKLHFLDLSGSEGLTTQALSQVFLCCKALKKLVLTECTVSVPQHSSEIEVVTSYQALPKVTNLGPTDELIFRQIEQYMQSIFLQASIEIQGDWLRLTVGGRVLRDQLAEVFTIEMRAFIQKYKISCRVDFSFLRNESSHPLTRFIKEISSSIRELVCTGSLCGAAPKNEPWHFHVLEKLAFHECPVVNSELQALFCPKVQLLDVRRCSRLDIVNLPIPTKCQRVDVRGIFLSYAQIVQILNKLPASCVLDFTPARSNENLSEESILLLLAALRRVSHCPDAILSSLEKTAPVTEKNCITYLKFAYEHALYDLQIRCQQTLKNKTQGLVEVSFRNGVCSVDARGIGEGQYTDVLTELSQHAPITLTLSDSSAWLLSFLQTSVGHLCFTGNIEILTVLLPNLKHLSLSSCTRNFTHENLESLLLMMPQLDTLTIEHCFLTDTIISLLCKEPKLQIQRLELIDCKFLTNRSVFDISKGMPFLEELSLRDCHLITDAILHPDIFGLVSLVRLDLSGTGVTDRALQYLLKSAHGLQSLFVARTQVSGRGFQPMNGQQFSHLKKIGLDACPNVTDEIVVSLGRMLPQVEDIELSQNANITQKALAQLIRTNPQIKTVTVKNCRQIPAILTEALERVYPAKHSFELGVGPELTEDGIALYLHRHILAKSACFANLSYLSQAHVKAIGSFYQEKPDFMLKKLPIRSLRFSEATPYLIELVQQFICLRDIVHTLWFEGSISKKLMMLVPEFKNIKRLYVKNSCVLPGSEPVDAETFLRLLHCQKIKLLHVEQMPGLDVRTLEFLVTKLPELRQLTVADCEQIPERSLEALANQRPGIECRYMRSQTMYQAQVDKTYKSGVTVL